MLRVLEHHLEVFILVRSEQSGCLCLLLVLQRILNRFSGKPIQPKFKRDNVSGYQWLQITLLHTRHSKTHYDSPMVQVAHGLAHC